MSVNSVGTVSSLWRFPVKSMRGEQLDVAQVTDQGILGDRAYALIDTQTNKVVSAKSVKLFPRLLDCAATFIEKPDQSGDMPPVQISLPNDETVSSDSSDVDRVLSAYFDRGVTLAQIAPDDYTIDQYHPDVEGVDPGGSRDVVVEQKLGSALFAELGSESPVAVGSFFDVYPLSVLTTSTLSKLKALRPESRFDLRRFRMNIIVDCEHTGFAENDWVGHELVLGDNTRLHVALPDPRCVMTTLAQDDLAADVEVIRTLVQHNRIQVGELGQYPVAGVYAEVLAPGTIRPGDVVELNQAILPKHESMKGEDHE